MNKTIKNYKYYYFIGIGGIGMSSIARYFIKNNKKIYGYDKNINKITEELKIEGCKINHNDEINEISNKILPNNSLIIYSDAISKKKCKQFIFFKINKYTIFNRSKILGILSKNMFTIAISGTHGKTTITTLLTHILYNSNKKILSIFGGISKNYKTNNIYTGNDIFIVEADEYNKCFLKLYPNIIAISSIDSDHIYTTYKNINDIYNTFFLFLNRLKKNGKIFINYKLKKIFNKSNLLTYSIYNKKSNYFSKIKKIKNINYIFDLNINIKKKKKKIKNLYSPIIGKYNLENVTLATSIAIHLKIKKKKIIKSLLSFKGVERRFNIYKLKKKKIYIDDFAHHPTSIKNIYSTINYFFPNKTKMIIFQPHLYSRTLYHKDNFVNILNKFNIVLILNIDASREIYKKKLYNIASKYIYKNINNKNKYIVTLDNVINIIKKIKFDIILTLGAGNISNLILKIIKIFN